MTKRNIPKFKRHPISRKLRKAYKPTEAMAKQHQQVVDETYSRLTTRPIHEQFGKTVEEWNASQSAWDVLHDMHGLRGM